MTDKRQRTHKYYTAEYTPRAWTPQKWWVFSVPGPEDNRSTERSDHVADSSAAEFHTPERSLPAEKEMTLLLVDHKITLSNARDACSERLIPNRCDFPLAAHLSPCLFPDSQDQRAPAWRPAPGPCRHHSRGRLPRTPLAPGAFPVASWLAPAVLQKHKTRWKTTNNSFGY